MSIPFVSLNVWLSLERFALNSSESLKGAGSLLLIAPQQWNSPITNTSGFVGRMRWCHLFLPQQMTLISLSMTFHSFLTNKNLDILKKKKVLRRQAKVVTEVESYFRNCICDLLPATSSTAKRPWISGVWYYFSSFGFVYLCFLRRLYWSIYW